jgi:hypothetical protein
VYQGLLLQLLLGRLRELICLIRLWTGAAAGLLLGLLGLLLDGLHQVVGVTQLRNLSLVCAHRLFLKEDAVDHMASDEVSWRIYDHQ